MKEKLVFVTEGWYYLEKYNIYMVKYQSIRQYGYPHLST